MQVQHETQLLEGVLTLECQNFTPYPEQSLDSYTIQNPTNFNAIEHIASCPIGTMVAAHSPQSNQIVLLDTKNHQKRDRFYLKACDKRFSRQSFTVKGFDFSPDGTRLAIGQSDNIIYLYKLANSLTKIPGQQQQANAQLDSSQTGSLKPTITGKFVCSSPISCLLWTELGIVFGTQDGKVKLIAMNQGSSKIAAANQTDTSANSSLQSTSSGAKVISVHNPPSPSSLLAPAPLTLAFKPPSILAIGFMDGNVITTHLNLTLDQSSDQSALGLTDHQSRRNSSLQQNSGPTSFQSLFNSNPIIYLGFLPNNTLCCAASDGKIVMSSIQTETTSRHDSVSSLSGAGKSGDTQKSGSSQHQIELKEDLIAMEYSQIIEVLVAATCSRLVFVKYGQEVGQWQVQASDLSLANSISLSSVCWTRDGLHLIVGTLLGSVELFSCSWSKQSVGEQLDICHIAKNRVRITDRARNLLATYKTQHDIKRVNLLDNGQSVIIWTTSSLLLARLANQWQQSEIRWSYRQDRSVKFCFDHPGFVLIYNCSSRQLMVVEFGQNAILYSIQMEQHIERSTMSVRRYPPLGTLLSSSPNRSPTNKRNLSASSNQKDSIATNTLETATILATNIDTNDELTQEAEIRTRFVFVKDTKQLFVVDLKTGTKSLIRQHDDPIVWLELSHTSDRLIFRDSSRRLHIINLNDRTSKLLLEECEFAKWLPESDILVAQSKHNICVWYNIDSLTTYSSFDSRSFNINNEPPMIDLSGANRRRKQRRSYPKTTQLTSECQLVLSNKQVIPLDGLKVKFYTELVARRLDSALELLEREAPREGSGGTSGGQVNLWSQLGWLAIDRGDCQVALRVFRRLGHSSMVEYLESCLSCEDTETQQRKLSLLRGDWSAFERLTDTQQVVATYKRLNRWSQLIDYLNRVQQFRQRDLAEQELRQWLIANGRYLEGAEIQAKNGDLMGAIELLMEHEKYSQAADLFVAEQKASISSQRTQIEANLVELARELKVKLVDGPEVDLERAALLSRKVLGDSKEALDLYLRSGSHELALELAKEDPSLSQQVGEISAQFGRHLMTQFRAGNLSRRKSLQAIGLLLAAGDSIAALEAAVELRDFGRGLEILRQVNEGNEDGSGHEVIEDKLRDLSKAIAESMLQQDDNEKERDKYRKAAIEALFIGGHFEQVVELRLEAGNFSQAFEVSLEHVNNNDRLRTVAQFEEIAEKLSSSQQFELAERIYLMLEKPEAAIELHRSGSKDYERMLELVAEFVPDSLESTLLMLARQLEAEGDYQAAERYLLRASPTEWTNVVRMYRLAGKWDEAYRVARANCPSARDPLLVQLAYFWAKSLASNNNNMEAACDLLSKGKLNCQREVIEFCCENKNYPFAMELTGSQQDKQLRESVLRRYAAHLEEGGHFERAERVLIDGGNLIEEAARMYLDNDRPLDAVRVVESRLSASSGGSGQTTSELSAEQRVKLTDLLNRTLVSCADRLVAAVPLLSTGNSSSGSTTSGSYATSSQQLSGEQMERLAAAQQLYLRAQRPELAVSLYRERGLWQEAIQVAQRFAPQLLEALELALDERVSGDVAAHLEQLRVGVSSSSAAKSKGNGSNRNKMGTSNNNNRSNEILLVAGGPINHRQAAAISSEEANEVAGRSRQQSQHANGAATKSDLGKFLDSLIDGERNR